LATWRLQLKIIRNFNKIYKSFFLTKPRNKACKKTWEFELTFPQSVHFFILTIVLLSAAERNHKLLSSFISVSQTTYTRQKLKWRKLRNMELQVVFLKLLKQYV
jgi:hypothetical protein